MRMVRGGGVIILSSSSSGGILSPSEIHSSQPKQDFLHDQGQSTKITSIFECRTVCLDCSLPRRSGPCTSDVVVA